MAAVIASLPGTLALQPAAKASHAAARPQVGAQFARVERRIRAACP